MKPLIFEFRENPTGNIPDYSLIEYDHKLNLSVDKLTRLPAIDTVHLETMTFTKTQGEGSDTDRDDIRMLMDTETITLTQLESSDSDKERMLLQSLMDTTTLTETTETSDQDKAKNNDINYYS
ncbi:hypothetical protein D3C78_1335430 [compost metagenome]